MDGRENCELVLAGAQRVSAFGNNEAPSCARSSAFVGIPLANIEIPSWDDLLALGSSCYELTGLGYLGVDIVLDKHYGPLILEINARPGLGIQIANQRGLKPLLKRIDQLPKIPTNALERAQLGASLFPKALTR